MNDFNEGGCLTSWSQDQASAKAMSIFKHCYEGKAGLSPKGFSGIF